MMADVATRDRSPWILGLAVAAVVLVVGVIGPTVPAPRHQANLEANRHIEKARRLLLQYDAQLSLAADQRSLAGDAPSPISGDMLNALLADAELDLTGQVNAELEQYAKIPAVARLPQAEQEFLTLIYGERWSEHQGPRPPTRMSSGMANSGLSHYQQRLSANAKLLEQALAEGKSALNITRGDYSTRQHVAANRLVGVVHFLKGLALSRRVVLTRRDLARQRLDILESMDELSRTASAQEVIRDSEIEARIAEAEHTHRLAAQALAEQGAAVSQLEQRVSQLQNRVQSAKMRAEAAREASETLQDFGIDFTDTAGFENFRQAYTEQARRYREALTEAHAEEHGSLGNATIDYTGDYIAGRYVAVDPDRQIEIRRGLKHYQQDLDAAQARLAEMTELVASLERHLQSLKDYRTQSLEKTVQLAAEQSARITQRMQAKIAEYMAAYDTVRQLEDEGVGQFEKALAAFKAAGGGVSQQENEARANKPTNPERAPNHYTANMERQEWLRGQIAAQQADCDLRSAMLFLGRYHDARASADGFSDLDVAAQEIAHWRDEAHTAQQAAIDHAASAIDVLEKAKRNVGEGNWLVAAEIGAAHYLLGLLDVELAANRALEWYKAALQNREAIGPEHADMRDYIQARLERQEQQ